MTKIKISSEREPADSEILVRVEYFIGSPPEGVMLFASRDATGVWCEADGPAAWQLPLPSGILCSVPLGETPALFFRFRLLPAKEWPFSDDPEEFQKQFSIEMYDSTGAPIDASDVRDTLKQVACWGPWELREDSRAGKVSSHFWGEMFIPKEPVIEGFLQRYRRPSC